MSIIIGIDVGGSTTKIVGFTANEPHKKQIFSPIFVKASDPVASVYGAFGKFTYANGIALSDVKKVMITGVGSAFVDDRLYGIETRHLSEFECVGRGGLYVSGYENAIIVSMGTGTAVVSAKNTDGRTIFEYMGGTGVGGGTIVGLSKQILGISDIDHLIGLAETGDIEKIDLRIGDITKKDLGGLPSYMTASNFGKADGNASPEDIASGIIHMVLQSIGQAAILSALNSPIRDFVLIGNLTQLPQCKEIFPKLEEMYGVRFLIPKYSEYRTAIGAALTYMDGAPIHPIK